jgi:hypothetical protein
VAEVPVPADVHGCQHVPADRDDPDVTAQLVPGMEECVDQVLTAADCRV